MHIFITGIAGFLGSHLADRMIELGHEVSGNDTLIGGYEDNVNHKATLYKVDCCDRDRMANIMQGVDIVIQYGTVRKSNNSISRRTNSCTS